MEYVRTKRLSAFEQLQKSYGKKKAKYVRTKRLPTFEQLQSYGRKGAKVRSEQWGPVRERARELAQEGSFAKRNEAARSIAKSVVAYAASLDLRMCEYYAPVTIARWLKNAGITFPTR